MTKKMIECPKCHGEGYTGSATIRMTENGPEDTTELCDRCHGTCKVEIAVEPKKHIEHSRAPMPVAGAECYSIYLPE